MFQLSTLDTGRQPRGGHHRRSRSLTPWQRSRRRLTGMLLGIVSAGSGAGAFGPSYDRAADHSE